LVAEVGSGDRPVAEPLVQPARPRVRVLDAELRRAEASLDCELLRCPDEGGADALPLPRACNGGRLEPADAVTVVEVHVDLAEGHSVLGDGDEDHLALGLRKLIAAVLDVALRAEGAEVVEIALLAAPDRDVRRGHHVAPLTDRRTMVISSQSAGHSSTWLLRSRPCNKLLLGTSRASCAARSGRTSGSSIATAYGHSSSSASR